MRLAFDLDGTVADMHSALAREARRLFPDIDPAAVPSSTPATGDPSEVSDTPQEGESTLSIGQLTSRQQRELWKSVCDQENWWETLSEIEPGALARLYRLVRDRRWELMFVTSRPETRGDTAQLQSYRWLAAQGYETPSIFVVHGSRGKIAAAMALDVLVDDRPENCLDIAVESKAKVLLIWHGNLADVPAGAKRLGIRAVNTISEAVSLLEQLDDLRQQPGIMRSIKRAFGKAPEL